MDKRIAGTVLSRAASSRVDAAEIFLRASKATAVEIKDGQVDAFDRALDVGAGLRVLIGGRMGFAFTADLSEAALVTLVDSAVTNARNSALDPCNALPAASPGSPDPVSLYDPEIVALSETEKINRVLAMEREAFGVDPRIKRMRKASASFSESETLIMNTNGAEVSYQGTVCSASIEVVAEENGESQAGWDFDVNRFYRNVRIEEVGRKAARKALALLGAKTISSVKAPVILESGVAEDFLAIMASGFSSENVQKRKSLFIGKIDQTLVSPLITVFDDGLLTGGLGSALTDDEIVPMKKKTLIDKGRLVMFLYNTYTANKDKTASTGNGMRGGFKGVPGVGITNLYIEPGKYSRDELVSSTNSGLYVSEIMGAHMANPISGDFSVGATGFWIENGKKAYPVREITIAGNILDLMKNVDAVGNDLRFSGRIGSPSLRIRELSIGGK